MEDKKPKLFPIMIGTPPITAFGYHDLLPKLLFTERDYEIPTIVGGTKQGKTGYFSPYYWKDLPTKQEQVEQDIKQLTIKSKDMWDYKLHSGRYREETFDIDEFLKQPEPFLGRTGTISTYDPDTINRKQLKARRKKAKKAKKARKRRK